MADMAKDLELKLKINADGSGADSAMERVIDQLDDVAAGAKKTTGKIVAFEEIEAGVVKLEARLVEATQARDEFLAGAKARKDAIIGAAVDEATAKLDGLERALVEAKRQRDYFLTQAETGGENGTKLFAKDIDAAKKSVLDLAKAVSEQKSKIASLPEALDAKAAKDAAKGIADYEKAVKAAATAVQSETGKLQKLEAQLQAAGIDTKNLSVEKQRLADKTLAAEKGVIRLKGQLLEEQQAARGAAEQTRLAGDAAAKAARQSEASGSGFGNLATGLKALAGAAVAREFITANASLESMEMALEAISGSSEEAASEMAFVRSEANRLGIEINGAANSYVQFTAASKGTALEGAQTKEIWSAIAERMSRLGRSSEETSGALNAVSQMMSKGQVMAEELRGQLGERLPGAFQVAARAMGVTTAELGKMLESGQVVATDFLPKFAAELRKTGGDAGDINTFNANLGRMKNALKDVATSIGDTGIFDAITWSMSKLADATSYATLGFKILAARIKGDDSGLEKLSEQARAVQNRLFGVGDATKKVAGDVQAMGAQVSATGTQIEQDVRNKIAGALISLNKDIKTSADAFKNLGIDPDEIKTGISAAERTIIESFKRIAADPSINGQVLLGSLVTAVDKVGKEAIPELGFAFKTAAKAGRQSAEEMATGLEILKTKLRDTGEVTKTLEDAYKLLGITSQSELKKAAESAKDAYDMIVKSGAPLADQAAAWKAYAEAAIAANGGVASSILQAEAAQHGLTIAIDESGKASIRTKDVLESMANAARRAAQEVAAANTAAMESAAIAASQARTSIGSTQDSIDGFVEHLHGMGTAVGSWVNSIRADMFAMSEAALESFNSMRAGVEGGTVGAYLEGLAKNARTVTERFQQQAEVAEYWRQRLADGADTARDLETATTILGDSLNLLGNQQLDPLRAAIADAERRMLDLRAAAQSTLDSIQDEWDQLNNNLDEIERRRAEKREAEIKAQLAAAQASGDREAIADLERSLSLLNQISAVRINDAKAREDAARTKSIPSPASAPATAGSTHQVTVTLNGRSSTINTTTAGDATSLAALLKQLESDMARA